MGVPAAAIPPSARHSPSAAACPPRTPIDLHPPANVARCRRVPRWTTPTGSRGYEAVGAWLAEHAGSGGVTSCSALRRSYRDILREVAPEQVFVHLAGDREVIAGRVAGRPGHFMPVALVDSQFATLEPLDPDERGVTVDVDRPAPRACRRLCRRARGVGGHVVTVVTRGRRPPETGAEHPSPRTGVSGTGGDEELQGDVVGIAERESAAVAGLLDAPVGDPQLVEAVARLLELGRADSAKPTWSSPVRRSSNASPDSLPMWVCRPKSWSPSRGHRVVEGARLLVLVQHRLGAEQPGVPLGAALQIGDRDRD